MAKDMVAKKAAVTKYSKEQLIKSMRYMTRRDLLGALLKDGERYSLKEVDAMLNKYLKGKVN